jgi:hypothetical protein
VGDSNIPPSFLPTVEAASLVLDPKGGAFESSPPQVLFSYNGDWFGPKDNAAQKLGLAFDSISFTGGLSKPWEIPTSRKPPTFRPAVGCDTAAPTRARIKALSSNSRSKGSERSLAPLAAVPAATICGLCGQQVQFNFGDKAFKFKPPAEK